jgi:hypothetical protein
MDAPLLGLGVGSRASPLAAVDDHSRLAYAELLGSDDGAGEERCECSNTEQTCPRPIQYRMGVRASARQSLCGARQTGSTLSGGPCGTRRKPPVRYKHVVWIVMENKGYSDIIGSPSAPYINSLAKKCGVAANLYAESSPSLPNYIAMTSGSTQKIPMTMTHRRTPSPCRRSSPNSTATGAHSRSPCPLIAPTGIRLAAS